MSGDPENLGVDDLNLRTVMSDPNGCGPTLLLGSIEIEGVDFHVECVRITTMPDGTQVGFAGDEQLQPVVEAIIGLDPRGGGFKTVTLPGYAGDWLIAISPYARG